MTPPDHLPPQAGAKLALLLAQGAALQQAGNRGGAAQAYQQAVRLAPLNPAGYRALLDLLVPAGDTANAQKVMQAVPLAVYQASPVIRFLHARLLLQLRQPAQALPLLQALEGSPELEAAGHAYNLGDCLARLGRHIEAAASFRRAWDLGLRADWLYLGWARSAQFTGDFATAERLYRELCRNNPAIHEFKYEQAILLLKTGQFERGFGLYPSRWSAHLPQFRDCPARDVGLPGWDGRKPLQSLLVAREQGVGDQIVFSAFLPALAQRVGHLGVAFDARLTPLLQRSWPAIECVSPEEAPAALRSRFQACISAADMGALAPEAIGWRAGCLRPDAARAARLREKYARQFPGKKLVGLSWMSKQSALSEAKSLDLSAWRPVLERGDCQFISLQYGDVSADLARARDEMGVTIHEDPEIDVFADLDGLAAQMAALDLVISTSNTTAHLAAATGARTWILLPTGWGLLWYWGHQGEHCAWYPEARLFRAASDGDWTPAIAGAAAALQQESGAPT